MTRLVRRLFLMAMTSCATTLLRIRPARADLFGGDDAILGGILAQAIQTVSSLSNMLTAIGDQLDAMHTMLGTLDLSSFDDLANLVNSSELAFGQLAADVQSVGYTLQEVNRQFATLYPSQYDKLRADQFVALYDRWSAELLGATKVAIRSQTSLSTLQSNADQAASILRSSRNASGQVAQMQATVQMLGLVADQNNTVIQSLATTGRVLATTAASTAAERRLALERHRRDMAGYTDRGPAVPTMTQLP